MRIRAAARGWRIRTGVDRSLAGHRSGSSVIGTVGGRGKKGRAIGESHAPHVSEILVAARARRRKLASRNTQQDKIFAKRHLKNC